jgi:hypothetical protein
VDVQDSTRECLEEGKGLFNKVQMVQCELSFIGLYRGSWLFGEAFDWFEQNGFNLYHIEPVFLESGNARLLQVDGLFVRP